MATSVYLIHRAINRPMNFRGLKGQYILLTAAGLICDLLLFIILYCCKAPSWFCVLTVLGLGTGVLITGIQLSKRYGLYGLVKQRARRRLPSALRCSSRHSFTQLKH